MASIRMVRPNGAAISELREIHKMTQLELAYRADLAPSVISYYERELKRSVLANLHKVAAVLGVDVRVICKDDLTEAEAAREPVAA